MRHNTWQQPHNNLSKEKNGEFDTNVRQESLKDADHLYQQHESEEFVLQMGLCQNETGAALLRRYKKYMKTAG